MTGPSHFPDLGPACLSTAPLLLSVWGADQDAVWWVPGLGTEEHEGREAVAGTA